MAELYDENSNHEDWREIIKRPDFKPSEYMRAKRPSLFSDTVLTTEPILEKSRLEFQLETLTSRRQEQVFEDFCRRSASLEICPNLKPQTGPTGGGDSKVDASTYPVAPELALRCYWGSPNTPSEEAWAFAFSCKKKWSGKIREDVKKIAGLERKFTKVYFITSRPARDKDRARIEDELRKEYGFEVHILDRTWIVNTVIEHKHEELAIEILDIRDAQRQKPQPGPKDTERQQQLDALLKSLRQPELYYGNDYAIAQDYLTAAKLARGLEKSRHEVDGLFAQARRIAEKNGHKGQIIRCGYNHAWTSLWWFDDHLALEKIYSEIEGYLEDTDNAEDGELFSNLWMLLRGGLGRGKLTAEQAKVEERARAIRNELQRLSEEKDRPSNSLHAETLLHLFDLFQDIGNYEKINQAFDGLKNCLRRSAGLGSYPVMQFINTFKEMGEFFGNLPRYDSLFSETCSIAEERVGETEVGELFYERGVQLLRNNRFKEAIVYLSKARIKLYKEETLDKCMMASLGCAIAYYHLGFYWAARMEALLASNIILRNVDSIHDSPFKSIMATKLMVLLELHLGRITSFMAWFEISQILVNVLKSQQYEIEEFENELRERDILLGCFFLNANPDEIKKLSGLEYGLERVNLRMARLAFLYALGETEILTEEIIPQFEPNKKKMEEFFQTWKKQPAAQQIPSNFLNETKPFLTFNTSIMQVNYEVEVRNDLSTILFAENLLGVIESAFSVANWANLAFIVYEVPILIDIDDSGANPPSFDLDTPPDSDEGYRLIWRPDLLEWLSLKESKETLIDFLKQFILKLLVDTTIDPSEDLKEELSRLLEVDTLGRALGISPTSILVNNLLGDKWYDINYWCKASASPEI